MSPNNYFKVAVWKAPEDDSERRPILQEVFPFNSESGDDTKRALMQCMLFWRSLPDADVHAAKLSVYRLCGCVIKGGRTFEQIGSSA